MMRPRLRMRNIRLGNEDHAHLLGQSANFIIKGQMVNTSGFSGHKVSVLTTQLSLWIAKGAIENT